MNHANAFTQHQSSNYFWQLDATAKEANFCRTMDQRQKDLVVSCIDSLGILDENNDSEQKQTRVGQKENRV